MFGLQLTGLLYGVGIIPINACSLNWHYRLAGLLGLAYRQRSCANLAGRGTATGGLEVLSLATLVRPQTPYFSEPW